MTKGKENRFKERKKNSSRRTPRGNVKTGKNRTYWKRSRRGRTVHIVWTTRLKNQKKTRGRADRNLRLKKRGNSREVPEREQGSKAKIRRLQSEDKRKRVRKSPE